MIDQFAINLNMCIYGAISGIGWLHFHEGVYGGQISAFVMTRVKDWNLLELENNFLHYFL